METVRCEELQLELSAALKSKSASGTSRHHNSQFGTVGATTVTWAPTPTKLQSQQHNHHVPINVPTTSISSADTLRVNHCNSGNAGNGTEIDRIIAKIEQACHPMLIFFIKQTTRSATLICLIFS